MSSETYAEAAPSCSADLTKVEAKLAGAQAKLSEAGLIGRLN